MSSIHHLVTYHRTQPNPPGIDIIIGIELKIWLKVLPLLLELMLTVRYLFKPLPCEFRKFVPAMCLKTKGKSDEA